ncbi:uncharacterized protein LOC135486721 isoform X2 [Lineus longissimus]|uniref:uncharacterized protein LOC135486721 isoform X2 n=1 Tax=Lineus longissimus TaxID=88925 RepID=UPI002B4F71C3
MEKPRVLLWCHPRSTSCAFLRSMMTIPGIKAFLEPFGNAYFFGSERVSTRYADEPITEDATFLDIKNTLEKEYPENTCIFSKDMPFFLTGKLDTVQQYIPKGFVHTFLIRNPRDAVMSYYDVSNGKYPGFDSFVPSEAGFEELWELYCLLAKNIGEDKLLVFDAGDLLESPELYLQQYCRHTGLPFTKKMVEWGDEKPADQSCFVGWEPWVEGVLNSTGLHKSATRQRNLDDYPDAVREEIEHSLPYYEKLYAKRCMPHPQ